MKPVSLAFCSICIVTGFPERVLMYGVTITSRPFCFSAVWASGKKSWYRGLSFSIILVAYGVVGIWRRAGPRSGSVAMQSIFSWRRFVKFRASPCRIV